MRTVSASPYFTCSREGWRGAGILSLSLAVGMVLGSAGCAAPPPQELIRQTVSRVPEGRRTQLQVTAYLAGPSARRAMRSAEDIAVWLDDWWAGLDPTPGTQQNEALETYMARAAFLADRFPGVPIGEWREPWGLFLKYGIPDAMGPEFVTGWDRPTERGQLRTPPSSTTGFTRERLLFGSPIPFTLIIREGTVQTLPGQGDPPGAPSLAGIWELIEDPTSSVIDKRQALIALSWYEHPDLAARLLEVPPARWRNVPDLRAPVMTRMAIRSAYRLGEEGARRLAALRAAGASSELLLRRASAGSYPAAQLRVDLATLSQRRYRLERYPERGPHPRLWSDPEELLADLAEGYPSPDRITGWAWQADVYLAFGPPGYLDEGHRIAYLLWSTPEVLGIGDTMLGWCQAIELRDDLERFLPQVQGEIRDRRSRQETATSAVSRVLGGGADLSGGGLKRLLEDLSVLAPPAIYQVGLPRGAPQGLRMTMDAVAFPAGPDSVEVQVSFGLPTGSVTLREAPGGNLVTDLRVSLAMMDEDLRLAWGTTRQEGYVIEGEGGLQGRFFLDTFRFKLPVGSYITYLSAQDPATGQTGGLLEYIDLAAMGGDALRVSPIMLATDIKPAEGPGKFTRGDERILPAPSRVFFYGQDLYFHYEVSNLTKSEVQDYVWQEVFYIIPEAENEGIITLGSSQERTSLQPQASSSINIDLSNMESSYQGPVFLVVLVTDRISGQEAVGATRLSLHSRPGG